jgi:mono/diheme cytochrome c family protein
MGLMGCVGVWARCAAGRAVIAAAMVMVAAGAVGEVPTAPSKETLAAYKANCAICHGDDGAGSAIGARLKVKDLRGKEVQDRPAAELEQAVRGGKGNMPPLGSRLSDEQIHHLIEYVRGMKADGH